MIAVASIAFALATMAASSDAPYHVYTMNAPAQQSGIYRLRLSDEAAKAWDVEQLQVVSIYDSAGQRQSCEFLRASRIGTMKKTYPLSGGWRDVDKTAQVNINNRFESAWQFAFPAFAAHESADSITFDWQTDAIDPGEVRLAEVPEKPYSSFGSIRASLRRDPSDPHRGHVTLNLSGQSWIEKAELHFNLPKEQLGIASPTMETSIRKPWTLERAGGPGWILFQGSGKAPYRVQLGNAINGCGSLQVRNFPESYFAADFPPEANFGAEIANAAPLGETQTKIRNQQERQTLGKWLSWAAVAAFCFIIALAIAFFPPWQ